MNKLALGRGFRYVLMMAIALIFCIIGPVVGQAQTPVFTVGNASGLPGSNITVSITFTPGAAGVYSTEFSLALPAGFSFVSKTAGAALTTAGYGLNPGGALKSVLMDNSGGTIAIGTGTVVIYTLSIGSSTIPGTYPGFNLTGLLASSATAQAVPCNIVAGSVTVTASTDTQAPSVPAGLTATAVSSSQINLSWTASTDNVAVTGYRIYRGGAQIATSTINSYSNTGLTASTAYSYTVAAYDAAGNVSPQSAAASATTPASTDTQAPSVPAGLTATAVSSSQINLAWNASTDNVAVTGYRIYRAGTQIATSTTTSFSNTGLSASTAYSYTVAAYDAAGNVSAQSTAANATTQTGSDSQPPVVSAISNQSVSSSGVTIVWTTDKASDSQVEYGVSVSYGISTVLNPTLTTAHSVALTGLTSGTTYHYRVKSKDAAGNLVTAADATVNTLLPAPTNVQVK